MKELDFSDEAIRKRAGIATSELGKNLNQFALKRNLNRSTIHKYLSGALTIPAEFLFLLWKEGYSLEWLMGGITPKKRKETPGQLLKDYNDLFTEIKFLKDRCLILEARLKYIEKHIS